MHSVVDAKCTSIYSVEVLALGYFTFAPLRTLVMVPRLGTATVPQSWAWKHGPLLWRFVQVWLPMEAGGFTMHVCPIRT